LSAAARCFPQKRLLDLLFLLRQILTLQTDNGHYSLLIREDNTLILIPADGLQILDILAGKIDGSDSSFAAFINHMNPTGFIDVADTGIVKRTDRRAFEINIEVLQDVQQLRVSNNGAYMQVRKV
jgi:hypothetical protein